MRLFNPKTIVNLMRFEDPERCGFLWKKRSETKGSFKKRYFIGCGNILTYFEKKADKVPLGFLILEGHAVEMLDDLTLVIRFPSCVESSRCYVLRSDTSTDMEQWMRVITRSGIDFFNLTLEELEDQLTALSMIHNSQSLDKLDLPTTPSDRPREALLCPKTATATSAVVMARPNPFNEAGPTGPVPRAPPRPKRLSVRHLSWLFEQSWTELHGLASSRYLLSPTQNTGRQ